MLTQAANSTGERAAELRAKAMQQLKALRGKIDDAQSAAVQKGKAAATATDDYVHENPWRSIVAAAERRRRHRPADRPPLIRCRESRE